MHEFGGGVHDEGAASEADGVGEAGGFDLEVELAAASVAVAEMVEFVDYLFFDELDTRPHDEQRGISSYTEPEH